MEEAADIEAALDRWLDKAWAMEAEVRAVDVEGAAARYRFWASNDGRRRGLIFVHGFMAHARWWDHIAPHFTDRFRVAAVDMTGMGDSDRRPAYSRRQYAREILAAARDAGMDEVIIVGHSFGSISSLYAAKLAPELVRHVVVVDAHSFREETGETRDIVPERVYADREEALSRYRLVPPGLWPHPRIVQYLAQHSLRKVEGGWSWKFDPEIFREATQERIRDEMRGTDLPTTFVHAGNSEIVGAAEVANFLANAPGCRGVVTVPVSHHHIMIEQPVGLVAALNGIIAGL